MQPLINIGCKQIHKAYSVSTQTQFWFEYLTVSLFRDFDLKSSLIIVLYVTF